MKKHNAKTIFIVTTPFENEIHNIIYTKELFVKKLIQEGYIVFVIVFCEKHKHIINDCNENYNVLLFSQKTFITTLLTSIRYVLGRKNLRNHPQYLKKRYYYVSKKRSLRNKIIQNSIFAILGYFREKTLLSLYGTIVSFAPISRLYKTYSPEITLLPFYSSNEQETQIIAAASKNKSYTIGVASRISVFDDVFYFAKPDRMMVWNELMKEQAIKWHKCPGESVIPVGILKCDYYKDVSMNFMEKKEFIAANDYLADRKIISIICGKISIQHACRIAEVLLTSSKIHHKVQVIIRANPDLFESQKKSTERLKDLPVFVTPGFSSDANNNSFKEQILATGSFLKNSDVIISAASTMMFESLYFDTPNIYLSFKEKNYLYKKDFILPILNEKGFKYVDNENELQYAVNDYLENPLSDLPDRKKLFRKYCYSVDGDACRQVFNEIGKSSSSFFESACN